MIGRNKRRTMGETFWRTIEMTTNISRCRRLLEHVTDAKKIRSWFLCGLALIFAGPVTEAAAQIRAGSITEIHGNASVERAGRSSAATLQLPVLTGDKVETADQGTLTVVLVDGSRLTLSESSWIVIDRSAVNPAVADSTTRFFVKLFKGTLGSLVVPAVGASPQFEVHTPNAVVGVRGTDFQTEYIEGKPCPGFPQCLQYTDVGVYKGMVEVRNPTSLKPVVVQITSGYETTVPCELPPATPGPLGMGDLTAPGYH
jgi:hypothetical protein